MSKPIREVPQVMNLDNTNLKSIPRFKNLQKYTLSTLANAS
jgi:hypothetical protein